MRLLFLALVLLVPVHDAGALPPAKATKMISAARELVGVEYEFGGRLAPDAGIDCLGLVFHAAEQVSGCGWRSYSVYPTRMVRRGELGDPVKGLAPIAAGELDVAKLEPGDVLLLLASTENSSEPALTTLDGGKQWVWHTGLYAGDGGLLHADIPGVMETDLREYLAGGAWEGVYVLRMKKGPSPRTCRVHPPMRR